MFNKILTSVEQIVTMERTAVSKRREKVNIKKKKLSSWRRKGPKRKEWVKTKKNKKIKLIKIRGKFNLHSWKQLIFFISRLSLKHVTMCLKLNIDWTEIFDPNRGCGLFNFFLMYVNKWSSITAKYTSFVVFWKWWQRLQEWWAVNPTLTWWR